MILFKHCVVTFLMRSTIKNLFRKGTLMYQLINSYQSEDNGTMLIVQGHTIRWLLIGQIQHTHR